MTRNSRNPIAVVLALALVVTACGDDAGSGTDPSDPSTQPAAEQDGQPADGESESPDTTTPALSIQGTPLPECVGRVASADLDPDEICLIRVTIEVTGLGAGGTYVWDAFDRESTPVVGGPVFGSEGHCTFLNTNFRPWLLYVLTAEDAPPPEGFFDQVFFSAAVRVSGVDYVSIGYDEHYGITSGGLSTGGPSDGSRGGQQWPIEGGTVTFGEPQDVGLYAPGARPLPLFLIEATWSGPSVENFTGEEASGNVSVGCEFAYTPPTTDE